jgi:pimeloyl-ACP methyl ester carboxylesterase
LVQFLTILRQVSDVVSSSPASGSSANFEQTRLTGPAGQLEVVRYGAGQSVLYFTTSSCPEETPEFRNALIKAGFCVVAPVRPGFRDSDPVRGDASDALIEDWLDPLLALTGPKPLLVGHREGGIVAAQAAERILAKGGAISGLVLLSTGAPMPDLSKFEDRPPSIRRSFLGAHVAAPALRLGYKTAARLFHTSTVGKDQIIRFFHKDSPADRVKLDEPRFYEITRDNLNLCFDNTDQIVRDVALWGSDWSEVLNSVIAGARVTFVHGAEHVFHRLDDLLTVVSDMDRASLTVIPGAGQLGIYEGRTSWRRRW